MFSVWTLNRVQVERRVSRAWYRVAHERRDLMKGLRASGRDSGADQHSPTFTHFCLGSVDIRSSEVDTSPRFQKTQLPDWDSRLTLDQSRSTLDPVSSRPVLQKWDSKSTLVQGRSTHSRNFVI
ncbi:hypothetical protein Taro_034265 [Colocasia esculenta]|uniref:Uncharacterized protein n=1 Tax=Colocasia esculenta TaxID=4460 RepID=A0A843W3K9_COLES|nr:hypothetical protein [Colocasia esculenta]